jgi:hypothetical protein
MRSAVAASCADLAKLESAWRRVVTERLGATNAVLERNGRAALAAPRARTPGSC